MKRVYSPALALALLLAPAAVAAQVPSLGGGAGAAFEVYRFGDAAQTGIKSVSLFSVPIGARAPIFGGTALEVSGAYARGEVERSDGSKATLSGFTDTQVALVVPVRQDVATVTAVVLLPTGKDRQTDDEALVAGIMAADLLPFRISNWGTGGAAGMSAAVAHSFGGFGMGASASYLVGRQYDMLDRTDFAYRPGNQLRARLAFDAAAGTSGKASLQLTYLHASDDELNGSNLFRPGDRYQAIGSYAFAAGGTSSGILYAGVLHRAKGTFLVSRAEAPSQQLFLGGGGMRLPVGATVFMPSVDVRVLRRTDKTGEGAMAGVGGSVELPLSAGWTLVPLARARFGNVQFAEGTSSGFTGAELALGIRFGGGQP